MRITKLQAGQQQSLNNTFIRHKKKKKKIKAYNLFLKMPFTQIRYTYFRNFYDRKFLQSNDLLSFPAKLASILLDTKATVNSFLRRKKKGTLHLIYCKMLVATERHQAW